MLKIVDLGYGREALSRQYETETMSSRLFYGLAQLRDRYAVRHVSLSSAGGVRSFVVNNIRALTRCDVLYVTYFFHTSLVLLALLRRLGLFRRRKIIVISHKTLRPVGVLQRMVFSTLDHVFFHSQKNLDESVAAGAVAQERCAFLCWGDDLDYIDAHLHPRQGDFFLSTGREQRDYPTLIAAFAETDAHLQLFTNRVNYANNYEYLEAEQQQHPNIQIEFVDNQQATTRMLVEKAASCLCVVNPLLQGEISYCVGLTSIVEAMALGKPVISTANPYSPVDIEGECIGFVVTDKDSWVRAVNYLNTHRDEALEMGRRARRLAEQQFNIKACADQLDQCISRFFARKD